MESPQIGTIPVWGLFFLALGCWLLAVGRWLLAVELWASVTAPCRDVRSVRPSPLNHDAVTFYTTDALRLDTSRD